MKNVSVILTSGQDRPAFAGWQSLYFFKL